MLVEIIQKDGDKHTAIDVYGNVHKFESDIGFDVGCFIEARIVDNKLEEYCQVNKSRQTFKFEQVFNGVSVGITEDRRVVVSSTFLDTDEPIELVIYHNDNILVEE